MSQSADNWSNYWQGRAASDTGAALAGVGIEDLPALNEFWRGFFHDKDGSARVLDLASGAGSALRHAYEGNLSDLTATDISRGALEALRNKIPVAQRVLCSADQLPFAQGSFDIVVSQFGFEYADPIRAIQEACHVIGERGEFGAICHYAGGAIEAEVTDKLSVAAEINESGYVGNAIRLSTEAMQKKKVSDATQRKFVDSQQRIQKIAAQDQSGLAQYLMNGFGQLFSRRDAYLLSDIVDWLNGMQNEVSAFIGRMESMRDAALSENEVSQVLDVMRQAGFEVSPPAPVILREGGKPGAWALRGAISTS